jgi:serine/threonine protein kinase
MLEQVLSAMRYLKNQLGIIHSDIKPQNILLKEDGTYCLADFGISKIL